MFQKGELIFYNNSGAAAWRQWGRWRGRAGRTESGATTNSRCCMEVEPFSPL